MSRPLLIFPCNGNAVEALDALGDLFQCIGFVDDTPDKQAQGWMGLPVWDRSAMQRFADSAVLAVPGGPVSFRSRRQVIDSLGIEPQRFATVIHPRASVSARAQVGRNVLLMAGVVLTSNAAVEDHVCILPNSVIHHDSVIGSWSLIGSGVTVAGGVVVGENCYVGSGSTIKNGVHMGKASLVGIGSNVLRNVAAMTTVAGNPARPLVQSTDAPSRD